MPGRPPKPAKLHRLQGTYRPDRHKAAAEADELWPPLPSRAPYTLKDNEKRWWRRLYKSVPGGTLKLADYALLMMASKLAAQIESGADVTAADRQALLRCFSQLGIDRAARHRMPIEKPPDDNNPFRQFMRGPYSDE